MQFSPSENRPSVRDLVSPAGARALAPASAACAPFSPAETLRDARGLLETELVPALLPASASVAELASAHAPD